MRADHPALVEQGQLALDLQHALDHEHDVRPAGVVFVEHQSGRPLDRPGQDPFAELRDLLAVAQHDGILADEVDPADVAIQVDADARPVEARRDLLDMGRLAGAVIALDHDPPVVREASEDRERRLVIEIVGGVDVRDVGILLAERRHLPVDVESEGLPDMHLDVRVGNDDLAHRRGVGRAGGGVAHCFAFRWWRRLRPGRRGGRQRPRGAPRLFFRTV